MKVLAIDAGNSRIKWGVHDGSGWVERGVVATGDGAALEAAWAKLAPAERVVAANVAGETVRRQIEAALARGGMSPAWLTSRDAQCGVRSSYAEPARLGPDRWAALIGARQRCSAACVVVNAGTTVTIDALSGEGIFLGGVIVAGYGLMREALARNTALLKAQPGVFSFFPDNTGDAIASGALNALAGAIERMCRYMSESGEGDAAVLISGGDAALLAPLLSATAQVVDNLVLEGLLLIGKSDV